MINACNIFCSVRYIEIYIFFFIPMVPEKRTLLHRAPVLPLVTPNTDWFHRLATYFGIQTWNILPVHIRNSNSLDLFKTNIKQYLFT